MVFLYLTKKPTTRLQKTRYYFEELCPSFCTQLVFNAAHSCTIVRSFFISEDLLDKLGLGDNIFIVHHKKCYVWQIKGGERRKNARKHFFSSLGPRAGSSSIFFAHFHCQGCARQFLQGKSYYYCFSFAQREKERKGDTCYQSAPNGRLFFLSNAKGLKEDSLSQIFQCRPGREWSAL